MKRIIYFTITLCLFFGNIKAQSIDSKPFRVDAMIGLGASKSSINWLFTLEPKYKIINNLSLGLRWENADIYSLKNSSGGLNAYGPVGTVNSFVVTGEFYAWHDIRVRPFIGGGAGIYLANFELEPFREEETNKFGYVARAGLQIGHLRIVAENNFIPTKNSRSLDYLTIKLGVTFGGGIIK